jgi:hypothetical protein
LLAEYFGRGCGTGVSSRENEMSGAAKMIQHHEEGRIRRTITDNKDISGKSRFFREPKGPS